MLNFIYNKSKDKRTIKFEVNESRTDSSISIIEKAILFILSIATLIS